MFSCPLMSPRVQFPFLDGKTVDVEAMNEAAWQNAQALMVVCEHCGRRFGVGLLEIRREKGYRKTVSKFIKGAVRPRIRPNR